MKDFKFVNVGLTNKRERRAGLNKLTCSYRGGSL